MNQNRVDLLDLLAALNAGKQLILGSTLVLCILAGGVSLLLPNIYTAEVQLLPPKEQKKGFGFADLLSGLPLPSLRLGEKGTPADIFVAILKSPTMRRRLAQDFDLMQVYETEKITDTIEVLKDNTDIGKSEEGTILIKVADRDPKRATDMANHYVVLLDSTNKSFTQESAQERYDFIQKLIRREEGKLDQAMDELQRFQAEHNAISIEEQAKSVIRAAAEMQMAAMELLIGRNSLLLSGFSTTHPQVRKLEQEFSLRPEELRSKIAAELQLEENLFLPLRDIPEVAQEFALVEKDVLVQAALLKLLLEQEAEALIEASNETSTVQVLDPATVPEEHSRPQRLLIVFITAILCLFASISYLFGSIYLRTLRDRWRASYQPQEV